MFMKKIVWFAEFRMSIKRPYIYEIGGLEEVPR